MVVSHPAVVVVVAACSPDPSNSSRLLCSYDLPGPAGQLYRDHVEDQMSIWEASGSLYPSIYIPSGLPTGSEQQLAEAYVRANVRVCVNVSARISNHPSVLPFGAFYYHNVRHRWLCMWLGWLSC